VKRETANVKVLVFGTVSVSCTLRKRRSYSPKGLHVINLRRSRRETTQTHSPNGAECETGNRQPEPGNW